MKLPIPKPDKQKEIVKEYNTIVNLIALNNQLIQKLEETAQTIYKQWFVDFEFPNEEGKPYKSSGGEMEMNLELEKEIPKGWEVSDLNGVISIKHGFAFKGDYITEEENDNILLTPGNFKIGGGFKGGSLKYYTGRFPKEYIFNEGDAMVTMTDLSKAADTIGYAALIPATKGKSYLHNQRLGRIMFKKQLKYFVYWLMRSRAYRNSILGGITGTTVKHTAPSKILEFKFSLPNIDTLIEKFESYCSVLQKKISLMEREKDCLIEMKDLLLSKLATIEN